MNPVHAEAGRSIKNAAANKVCDGQKGKIMKAAEIRELTKKEIQERLDAVKEELTKS